MLEDIAPEKLKADCLFLNNSFYIKGTITLPEGLLRVKDLLSSDRTREFILIENPTIISRKDFKPIDIFDQSPRLENLYVLLAEFTVIVHLNEAKVVEYVTPRTMRKKQPHLITGFLSNGWKLTGELPLGEGQSLHSLLSQGINQHLLLLKGEIFDKYGQKILPEEFKESTIFFVRKALVAIASNEKMKANIFE